jgi:hypothetical protein
MDMGGAAALPGRHLCGMDAGMSGDVCVALTGLCCFSSLPRVAALKRLTLGCYVWPFQGLGALCQSPLQGSWGGSADRPFRDTLPVNLLGAWVTLSATLSKPLGWICRPPFQGIWLDL